MALNPESRRQEGVSQLTPNDMRGSVGSNGDGVELPTATYRNPGATPNLRGVEPNTGKSEGSNVGEPVIQTVTAGEAPPRGEVFHSPDSSGVDTIGDSKAMRTSADSSSKNSMKMPMIHDSFSAMGETYPANGGLDGES